MTSAVSAASCRPASEATRLHDDRPALHGSRDVERPAHLVVLAAVTEDAQPLRVEVGSGSHVANERVVGEAVPQPGHHVVELTRAAIAFVMLQVLFEPEIQRCVGIRGGDDVPAGAATAQVIERREAASDVKRLVERGRRGGHEPDALGDG